MGKDWEAPNDSLFSCSFLLDEHNHCGVLPDVLVKFNRYILEGKELEFYMKKLQRKKGKGAGAA